MSGSSYSENRHAEGEDPAHSQADHEQPSTTSPLTSLR